MHKLLTDAPGSRMLLLGNEAIARGAVEAGVAVAAAYPGTPSSEISLNFFQLSRESDLSFEYSVNEKVSLEVAAAAAATGVRAMCVMKHVGMNVAADVLMTLAYVGVKGGLVILVADDPFMFSSQNEQDSRYYARLAGLPMLEPSGIEEAKEMTRQAFDLSEQLGEPVLLRTTTRINHSTAVITLGDIAPPVTRGGFERNPMRYVTVPAVSRQLHVRLLDNLARAEMLANGSALNFVSGSGRWGVVTSGVSYAYVTDAISDLGLTERVRVLRLGFSHPLPKDLVRLFLSGCDRALVVEEGEPVLEEAVKAAAQEGGLTLPIKGKGEAFFSRLSEYDPALVREKMATFFGVPGQGGRRGDQADLPSLPPRPPTLCAGCSHRATFHAVKKAAEALDAIYPTDIGCYTLGMLPPLSMADYLICMGSSTGTAAGFSRTLDRKVIAFCGDSTFFHSAMAGLVNAVFNNHNFTLVILDNGTTAMTGHQPHPGVDMEKLGLFGYGRIDIEEVVRALGVGHVAIIEPFKLRKSIETLKEAFTFTGVSVVISREICTLYGKSLKLPGRKPFMVSDRCRNHRECVDQLGCPAFFLSDNRVAIDPDRCTGCAVCAQVCPENAIVPAKTAAIQGGVK
ncbi:MAG: indolepyruvate ferredoxin oxidoreductase subunit alpha [Desulfobulbaceae bacterium]